MAVSDAGAFTNLVALAREKSQASEVAVVSSAACPLQGAMRLAGAAGGWALLGRQ